MRLTFTACIRRVLLLVPLFLCTILLANDTQHGEKITLSEKAIPLKSVFKKITSQTGIKFVYSNRLIDDEQKVNVSVKDADLEEVMQQIFVGKKFELQRTSPKSVVLIVHEKVVSSIPTSAVTNDIAIIDVSGTVSDVAGEKLPGATVLVKGTNKATMTDGEGRFRLAGVLANARIMVSYTGYEAEEVKLQGQRELRVKLQRGENKLSEVVVAYGMSTQRSNTGAVTVVKGEQIQNLPNRSFDKSLQGLVPGLQITNGTGQPGGGVSSMVQRGISTGGDAFSGSTVRNPLIVIDGIPVTQDNFQNLIGVSNTPISNPLAQLNPSDIESITVLKDAAAIALYGSKSSNGVILVTTKKGKIGKTVIGIRSQLDMAVLPKRNLKNIPTQNQYLQMLFDSYRGANPTWSDNIIKNDLYNKFPYQVIGGDTVFYSTPDWGEVIYNNAAPTFSNEISVSGGNEKGNFYINLEYTKQDGIVRSTGYDRKSLRINFENKPIEWLTLGTKTSLSYNTQSYTNATEGENSYGLVQTISPLNPIRNSDGNYILYYPWGGTSTTGVLNPLATLEYNASKNTSYRGISKIYGQASFLKYFNFSSSLGIDFMLSEAMDKVDPRFRGGVANAATIVDKDRRRANVLTTNLLSAKFLVKNNHDINFLLGQEAQILSERTIGGEVKGDSTALPYYDQLTSPGYTATQLQGYKFRQTLLSWFGQVNYGFKRKIFFSASMRRDGSSRFGSGELWGTYWSLGGGYVMTEDILKSYAKYVSFLKLRGSVGVSGNSGAVDPSTKFDVLRQGLYVNRTSVVSSDVPGNPEIMWEKTLSWNVGLDARLFNDRLMFNIDVYGKSTKDLIYSINLPTISGFISVKDNIGDIKNRGIELSMAVDIIRQRNWRWNASASLSSNKNILVRSYVPFSSLIAGNLANEEGRNYNSFYLRQWVGVDPSDGKPLWVDSTGKSTSVYNNAKREFVGKPQPDGFGTLSSTLSYKEFEFSFQFYYQYGFQVLNEKMMTLVNDGATPYINQASYALDYWKKPGDISPNPRRLLNNKDGGRNASTRYLIDGDYIRLSNVALSYNFNPKFLNSIKLKMIKVFVQGNNLGIWTKLSDQDPDNVNIAGGLSSPYPNAKNYSIGVQANF
ncbi:SusC/RagA family TonB-linked outer membrane protein [Chitinophaga sp. SYP-B3965]|uniref:SusC/RagA family TonB-linked outer membrane protein n=1 Tax=Chitinophaga sp. SYP-B3965 TaxID=2663120 RepID=UPI001299C398|nr:SusC/RagA family TonB-linked outer membrane protein [Chitinophaga sp. SYP-B3965]MRG47682.1 SusC/RagA family TonB-linked outer membrane protein [Chitinophaga sp. SYP-B3965]